MVLCLESTSEHVCKLLCVLPLASHWPVWKTMVPSFGFCVHLKSPVPNGLPLSCQKRSHAEMTPEINRMSGSNTAFRLDKSDFSKNSCHGLKPQLCTKVKSWQVTWAVNSYWNMDHWQWPWLCRGKLLLWWICWQVFGSACWRYLAINHYFKALSGRLGLNSRSPTHIWTTISVLLNVSVKLTDLSSTRWLFPSP